MVAPRKLLYVSPHACPAPLHAQLKARHWQLVHARSLKAACALLRQQTLLVALLALDTVPRTTTVDFEACREANDLCEWVGLLPAGAMNAPPLREMVLRHFFDHHTHPADAPFLCQSLGHAYGRALLRSGLTGVAPAAPGTVQTTGLLGDSAAMVQLRRKVQKLAATTTPVLISGESGVGKEMVARTLHACSSRANGPWVVMHCGEPDLDHARVFASAVGGTLLLDEVSELPREGQSRLLRFLVQHAVLVSKLGPTDAPQLRLVATTSVDLGQAAQLGRFRQDLFYRLSVVPLAIPPLRERKEDIALLAGHFQRECARGLGASTKGFSRLALAALAAHDWPGNVRELRNRVERAVLLAERRMIGPADLELQNPGAPLPVDSLESTREQAERSAITRSLDRFSHNVSLAARELGVSRMTLYRLMAKHSLPRPQAEFSS